MFPIEEELSAILRKREENGLLRRLSSSSGTSIDFCSNDYLGFACSEQLREMIDEAERKSKVSNGSGGSRLLAGNSKVAEELESFLAGFQGAQAALLFNSGYDANIGLFSSVPQKKDTILYDELIHASVHDGIRLSHAQSFPFRHNDIGHLKERIKIAKGNIFIAVESVYSMDGDIAPLEEIADICAHSKAQLIVDEAHATGVFGKGLVQRSGLEKKVFARVHTFGKAMGCHGAVVVGSTRLKEYLVNHARSFIYTTALPLHSLISIQAAYRLLEESNGTIKKLHELIDYFRKSTNKAYAIGSSGENGKWLDSRSPIQSLLVHGNENVRKLANRIQNEGLDVRPILSPTVPRGKERLRVCLHTFNTKKEVDRLFKAIG